MARQKQALGKSTSKRNRPEKIESFGGDNPESSDNGSAERKKKVRWEGSRTTSVGEESGKQSDSEEESSLNSAEKVRLLYISSGRI